MKNILKIALITSISVSLTSCATMFGGCKYYATVQVPNHPTAKIEYKKEIKGVGEATFKVPRKEAGKFSVTITEEGCKPIEKNFIRKTFRGWAFVGSVVGWTGLFNGIPLPWGVIVDAATGAWWKPNINEEGVSKRNFKHYNYTINYQQCEKLINKDSLK